MPCKSESHSSALRGSVLTKCSHVHIASLRIQSGKGPATEHITSHPTSLDSDQIRNHRDFQGWFTVRNLAFTGRPTSLVFLLSLGRAAVLHEVRDEVDGQREDDGRVLLRRDRVEGLKRKGEAGYLLWRLLSIQS